MAAEPLLPLPEVPAVDPAVLDPAAPPAPAVLDPAPPAVVLDALDEPEPMRAFVSMYMPLRELDAVLLLAVVPLVPVAPDAAPLPPWRHPVTVIVRALLLELPAVWLLEVPV